MNKKTNEDETVAEIPSEPAPNAFQMASLLGNVIDQKPGEFATTFDQLMRDRIAQKVADRKVEMARDAFGVAPGGEEEPEVKEPNEQPEVKEPDENGNPVDDEDEDDDDIDNNGDEEDEKLPPETAKTEEIKPVNELSKKLLSRFVNARLTKEEVKPGNMTDADKKKVSPT